MLLTQEMEKVRRVYAGLNANDVLAMTEDFAPEVEWVEPTDFPPPGLYQGIEAVRTHIQEARETWAEGTCEPERLVEEGGRVVAFIRIRVRLKERLDWLEGSVTDVFTFRDGKVVQVRTFHEWAEALEWARGTLGKPGD